MREIKDIENNDDVKLLVNEFYDKVKKDDLLAPIFFEHIPDDWQPHLNRMYLFWGAALLGEKGYLGNPFSKHAKMHTLTQDHFDRWLSLFGLTVDTNFCGEKAEDAKWRASIMADNFIKRLLSIKRDGTITIV
jgi:hemoglobin